MIFCKKYRLTFVIYLRYKWSVWWRWETNESM